VAKFDADRRLNLGDNMINQSINVFAHKSTRQRNILDSSIKTNERDRHQL